jgi:hypothetical protein
MNLRSGADISPCGIYRYWLERQWADAAPLVFVMLNPSTADAKEDDPTIRRCMGFAKREGAGGIVVVNLFALRATDPKEIGRSDDPIGPANSVAIGNAMLLSRAHKKPMICAWGASKNAAAQAKSLKRRAADFDADLVCLGRTKSGAPRHPLYIKADQPLVAYT